MITKYSNLQRYIEDMGWYIDDLPPAPSREKGILKRHPELFCIGALAEIHFKDNTQIFLPFCFREFQSPRSHLEGIISRQEVLRYTPSESSRVYEAKYSIPMINIWYVDWSFIYGPWEWIQYHNKDVPEKHENAQQYLRDSMQYRI